MSTGYFHVVGRSASPDGGIYSYKMDHADAKPVLTSFTHLNEASYLIQSDDGKLLYASGRTPKEQDGYVAVLKKNRDRTAELLKLLPSSGISTCHLAVAPGGNFLYAANYLSGDLVEFLLCDGIMSELTKKIIHHGSGPNVIRQNGAHPHFVGITPDEKYLYVVDLGIDALKVYPFHPAKGIDPDGVKTSKIIPAGSGPRHVIWAPNGRMAYLLNELGNTVMSLRHEDGTFEIIDNAPTLPRFFDGESKAAAIKISPDGHFLFASNRGFDSIACFQLDGKGGMQLYDLVYSGGGSPRDINFLPGGKMLAAANESGRVSFFDYDPATGKLMPNGLSFEIPGALCVFSE